MEFSEKIREMNWRLRSLNLTSEFRDNLKSIEKRKFEFNTRTRKGETYINMLTLDQYTWNILTAVNIIVTSDLELLDRNTENSGFVNPVR